MIKKSEINNQQQNLITVEHLMSEVQEKEKNTRIGEESIIVINEMNKWYGEFHVLKSINLDVKEREVVVIIGPSGSGKSTLIRCINRLEEHQEGDIIVDGIYLTNDVRNISAIRRETGFSSNSIFFHILLC
jgi:general L-amino acid transport system ATP-binding protein